MINNKLIDLMSKTPTTLKEIAVYFERLSKEHTDKEIASKSGVDKNVIYRIRNAENITIDNYLKIRNAFPDAFRPASLPFISELPILGQITDEETVNVLNPTQPNTFAVPTQLIEHWKPVHGYLYVDNRTFYNDCVHLFTSHQIDSTKITDVANNRIIMIYPDGKPPKLCYCSRKRKDYKVFNVVTKELITSIPIDNNMRWSKFLAVLPQTMMEFFKEGSNQNTPQDVLNFPSPNTIK